MRSRHSAKPAAAVAANGLQGDRLAGAISDIDNLRHGRGQLVDRHGHVHTETIFLNWSAGAIRALGIRRVDDGGGS